MAPKKVGEKIRESQVFDIVTGYFPEIAASVNYATRKGKGQTGIKHIRKRGFSNQTIERDRTKGLTGGGGVGHLISQTSASALTKETVLGAAGTTQEGQHLWQRKEGVKDDPNKIWYKFTGGGDMYKLYGDQVWYMHGVRKKDTITEYINSEQFGDKAPQFGQIYSDKEGELVKEARNMANDIFDAAVDQVDKSLKESAGNPMSAEEMGYKDGDFEYISRGDLLAKISSGEIQDPNGELEAQLGKVSGSMANDRDLYKIRDGKIELMQDVTEMEISDVGQHGITELPQELIDAIAEVKAGDNENMDKLRQGVASMYTNAIEKHYNPQIMEMKGFLESHPQKGKGKAQWKHVLKAINKAAGKTKTKTGTKEMGEALGVEIRKFGFMQTGKKSAEQTSIELVAHVLGTMNEHTSAAFRQAHRVHTYEPQGISVYASADLTPQADWLFKAPVKESSIQIVEGYNVTLAQEQLSKESRKDNGLALHKNQKHAYSGTKVTGMAANGTSVSSCVATMGVSKGLRPTTTVHIPALGKLEEELIALINEEGIPDLTSKLGQEGSKLQKRMFGLGKNRKLRKAKWRLDETKFWALPYIGVLQSEHIAK